jgi:thiamine-monophosphate kinase
VHSNSMSFFSVNGRALFANLKWLAYSKCLKGEKMTKRTGDRGSRGTVSIFGERPIIEVMRNHFDVLPGSPVPFGDDVAAVSLEGERLAVLKTDMLVDKTDVPVGMSFQQAARKAVVMNVSDFAAKGVQPLALLVSLGLPRRLMMRDIEEIAEGLNEGAREYGAYVVGGDTGEASDLVVAVSLYGTALRSRLVLRSGAKVGDVVAVTGFFGKPAAGLRLVKEKCEVSGNLREVLLDSVFVPKARLREGLALAGSGGVTSSVDSSDGLALSLYELSRASGVGFVLDNVPVADEAKRFAECCHICASDLALYGGEEYELVVTVKPECWGDAEADVAAVGGRLLRVGRVTREKSVLMELDGKKRLVEARGWEHFKSEP